MIQGKNIQKNYGNLHVLKGVDINIEAGEIVSIVGKSGAGKSTLLHILGTLDKQDKGSLIIQGKDISTLSEKELASFRNKNLGFIFQFHHLLPEFNALENVCIPAFIAGTSEEEATREAKKLLTYLGLSDRLHHKPNELSGGEQQRVAVARALINQPKILLADEPTGNLDSENSSLLMKLFGELRAEFNQTIVMVTHDQRLSGQTDRIIRMKDGLLIKE